MAIGLMQQIRAKLEAGEGVKFDYFPGANKATFSTSINRLKRADLCGKGLPPLAIVRDKDTGEYRLAC
jgi:hypothetical protein